MGNEISTLGGAVATAGTAIAAGVTFGQIESVNNAVIESAAFTAHHAQKTVVRHVGETAVMAVATVGASVASGVTFGQITTLNDVVVHCAMHTAQAGINTSAEVVSAIDGLTDSVPIVGHAKGAVYYALGNDKRGARAMKSSSRTIGVIGGGIAGIFVGGPVGAIAGGIGGGAAMDGIITGAEFGINDKYRPSGYLRSATQIATATSIGEGLTGAIGIVSTTAIDGLTGLASGSAVRAARARANAAATTTTAVEASIAEGALESSRVNTVVGAVGGVAVPSTAYKRLLEGGAEIASGTVSDTNGYAEEAIANLTDLATATPLPASSDAPNTLTSNWDSLMAMGTDVLSAHLSRSLAADEPRVDPNDTAASSEPSTDVVPRAQPPTTIAEKLIILKKVAAFAINQVIRCANDKALEQIPEQIVADALKALEGIIGAEVTQFLYRALTSDMAQAILQSMWNITSRRVASARELVEPPEVMLSPNATDVRVITLASPSTDLAVHEHSAKRLYFVLIAIYAITAVIMSFFAEESTLRIA